MRETDIPTFQSMKELQEHRKANIAELAVAGGEKKMIITPGFDLRNTADSTYGQHSATLVFIERRGDNCISCEFFTGWDVNFQPRKDFDGMMCTGLYYHARYKKDTPYPEYAHLTKECAFTGKQCYGEAGSALYGDVIKGRLIRQGSQAVWDEIDAAFKERYESN